MVLFRKYALSGALSLMIVALLVVGVVRMSSYPFVGSEPPDQSTASTEVKDRAKALSVAFVNDLVANFKETPEGGRTGAPTMAELAKAAAPGQDMAVFEKALGVALAGSDAWVKDQEVAKADIVLSSEPMEMRDLNDGTLSAVFTVEQRFIFVIDGADSDAGELAPYELVMDPATGRVLDIVPHDLDWEIKNTVGTR